MQLTSQRRLLAQDQSSTPPPAAVPGQRLRLCFRAKAFSAVVIDITTPGLQGGKLPRVVVVVGRVRDAYMPGVNVCLRRAALLSKHACSCYKRACLLPGTHPPPPALAAVALLATACSCPACAALQPAANGTSPPAAPVVQAADKPAP